VSEGDREVDRVLRALLRTELRFFIRKVFATVSPGEAYLHNWHIEAIAHQLTQVHLGNTKRLLVNQPPRSLKSICVSVAYVAWLLGHDPCRRVIVSSYSGDFAAELHRQFRLVVGSEWYQALFAGLHWAKETGLELVTTQGGSRYSTSIGGTLTGRGADLIIIDDPLNANEALSEPARKRVIDWYSGSLVSRLNDKERGAIIAVMQRLHEDDLAGHLLRQGGWTHLNLPAIAGEDEVVPLGAGRVHRRKPGEPLHPERESLETLQKIKSEVGSLLFSAQYLQQPIPVEGDLIRRSWLRTYDQLPASDARNRVVQSWDVALMIGQSNDYSVCTTWHINKDNAYLVHVYRGRIAYPDLRRKVIAMAAEYGATTILIENAGPGMNLLQDLWDQMPRGMTRPIGIKPEGSKADRMAAQSAKIEAGHVLLPKDAPWLADFLSELLSFPGGRHDDQVDSVSQFLIWFQQSAYQLVRLVAPIIVSAQRELYSYESYTAGNAALWASTSPY
jgi:predicted phage terminase large subunit-like protein